jgi:hypothetical protein
VKSGASRLAAPVAIALGTYLLWNTPLVFPLKIFVVFLHEISHGLAAVATGGSIERIEVSMNEGGVCWTRGGWRFVITSAGYLGSLAWGAALLLVGGGTKLDRPIVAAIGVFVLGVSALYVRGAFGLGYGLAAGVALLLIAARFPAAVSDALLRVTGVVSCLYAVWDIASDVLLRDVPGSDANALARLTGIPGVVWGVLWMGASLLVLIVTLRIAARKLP